MARNSCGAPTVGRDERAQSVGTVHRAALLLHASILRGAEHFALHEPLGKVRLAHEVGAGRLVARRAHLILARAEQTVAVEAAEARLVVQLLVRLALAIPLDLHLLRLVDSLPALLAPVSLRSLLPLLVSEGSTGRRRLCVLLGLGVPLAQIARHHIAAARQLQRRRAASSDGELS